jgi:hypothetical protein
MNDKTKVIMAGEWLYVVKIKFPIALLPFVIFPYGEL